MRTQPAITILTAALLLFGVAGVSHASTRKQTSSNTSSSKKTTPVSPSAKKSTAGKKRTSSRRRTSARMRMPAAPTPARISEIQSALASQGTYQGTPNGKWDAATIDAMQRFQQTHGLSPTGKLDAPSLEKLGLGSDTAGVASPLPQASAGDPPSPLHSQNP